MKAYKSIFLVAAAALLYSCNDRLFEEEPAAEKYVTVTATVRLDTSAVTKTSMDCASGKVKWSEGDYVTLYGSLIAGTPVKSSSIEIDSSDASVARFTFTLTEEDSGNLKYSYNYIYYGKQTLRVDDYRNPTSIALSATQTYVSDQGFSEFENAAIGYCAPDQKASDYSLSCTMRNLFGILKVNIELEDGDTHRIQSVRLTDSTEYLAGTFRLDSLKSSAPKLSHIAGSGGESRTIEKVVDGAVTGGDFYFLVPPGTLFKNGFRIYVYTQDGYYGGKKITPKKGGISRSEITTVTLSKFKKKRPETSLVPTANSYIVPAEAGIYAIPAQYKGNGYQGNSIDSRGIIGDVAAGSNKLSNTGVHADVIWQTKMNGDVLLSTEIISNVFYFVNDNVGYIGFHRSGIPGNALVALKNDDGEILWSWHLWITDEYDLTRKGVTLYKQDSTKTAVTTIMDRNLGALYADPTTYGVQTYGLAYQFGRKDPFPGPQDVGTSATATTYPTDAISESVAISLASSVANPSTWAKTSCLWCSDAVVSWGDSKNSKLDSVTCKSLYDPCPAGWRVLEEQCVGAALGDTDGILNRPDGESEAIGVTNKYAFKLYNKKDSSTQCPIWFPAAGKATEFKNVGSVGDAAYVWGANSVSNSSESVKQAYSLVIEMTGTGSNYTSSLNANDMSVSMPVRCEKWTEPKVD